MKRTKTILPLKKRERIFKPSLTIDNERNIKTTAISPSRKRDKVICSMSKNCWYGGTCPHRVPHRYDEKGCSQDFCSLMNFKNCSCNIIKEKE